MKVNAITASIDTPDGEVSAELHPDTGRLRITERGQLRVELFPPHSWCAVAAITGYSRWSVRPREADMRLVAESFVKRRFGMQAYRREVSLVP